VRRQHVGDNRSEHDRTAHQSKHRRLLGEGEPDPERAKRRLQHANKRTAGRYGLNSTGQPHSAMIADETVALVIYTGEPDEIRSMEVVDIEPTR